MEYKRIEDIEDISALSKEDRERYSESIKVYRDNLVTEAAALEKGKRIGEKIGERRERYKNARKLRAMGCTLDFIAEATGLSLDEISTL